MASTCTAMERFAASIVALRIALAPLLPFGEGPAGRQIAVDRIVRRGLIGDDVGPDAAPHEFGEDLGGVAEQADRDRLPFPAGALDDRERLVEARRLRVEIAGAQPRLDAARLAFDREQGRAGHGRRERLRPAHAAEAAGQDPSTREVAAVMPPARPRRRSRRCPARCPASRYRSTSPRSSGRTS